ncbi:RidA family protein [Streptomyces sp. Je 1-332]|uniref:RidA family protein n=1 Tax=Streptomyces sp. Je 1-332 TaxID=3231270 RepID=UPI0034582BBB
MTAPARYQDALHPYTPVRRAGDLLFVSGQLGIDSRGQLLGNIEDETRRALDNLRKALEQQGALLIDIVKIGVFLHSMADRNSFDAVYTEYFPGPQRPARTCVAVGELPFGARVEIEAVAHAPVTGRGA